MLEAGILIALVTGIVEVIKRAGSVNSKYAPLMSLVLSVILAFVFREGISFAETIFTGLVVGLSASGLYSGSKTLITR